MRELYLGPYRLLNMLANGQTTHVWEAIHDASRRRVAIKRLKAEKPKRSELGLLRHEYAVAKTFDQPHPVFCLVNTSLAANLEAFLKGGGRKIDAWYASLKFVEVSFDDEEDAFRNINTREELSDSGARLDFPQRP